MITENMGDPGTVHMHKRVIGDIAAAALEDVPGVRLAKCGILGSLFEFLGCKNFPGIAVMLDEDGAVHVRMRVCVDYGLSIPDASARVQEAVRRAVEAASGIDLKEININIHSVQRRSAPCGS